MKIKVWYNLDTYRAYTRRGMVDFKRDYSNEYNDSFILVDLSDLFVNEWSDVFLNSFADDSCMRACTLKDLEV